MLPFAMLESPARVQEREHQGLTFEQEAPKAAGEVAGLPAAGGAMLEQPQSGGVEGEIAMVAAAPLGAIIVEAAPGDNIHAAKALVSRSDAACPSLPFRVLQDRVQVMHCSKKKS